MFDNVKQFRSDKIFQHLDRLQEWSQGGKPIPVTVELDPTNRCNLKCYYCSFGDYIKDDKNTLPREDMLRVISELAELGVRGITFTGGGEPLMNKHTPEAVEHARKCGMDVAFITNGIKLDEEITKTILKNCVWFRVSLDASNAEMYGRMHGVSPKIFDKVVNNIGMAAKLKKKMRSKCTLGVGYLTGEDSYAGILEATKLCKKLGVDYIQFRPVTFNNPDKEFQQHERELWHEIEPIMHEAFKEAKKGFDVLFSVAKYGDLDKPNFGRTYKQCLGQHFASVIGASGDVWVCCHLRGKPKYSLGNIKEQSFKDIWFSEKRDKIMKSIDLKRDCMPLCRLHPQNKILWSLRGKVEHKNFL